MLTIFLDHLDSLVRILALQILEHFLANCDDLRRRLESIKLKGVRLGGE